MNNNGLQDSHLKDSNISEIDNKDINNEIEELGNAFTGEKPKKNICNSENIFQSQKEKILRKTYSIKEKEKSKKVPKM